MIKMRKQTMTMYELLGALKNGNAPKKIKYNGEIWERLFNEDDYWNKNEDTLSAVYNLTRCLDDEVEIYGDKIEELSNIEYDYLAYPSGSLRETEVIDTILKHNEKINQIIRFLKQFMPKEEEEE